MREQSGIPGGVMEAANDPFILAHRTADCRRSGAADPWWSHGFGSNRFNSHHPDLLVVAAFYIIGLLASVVAMLTPPGFGEFADALQQML